MSFSDDRFDFSLTDSERCKECGSTNCLYDKDHGFWECQDCHACWGYDQDDPDYRDGGFLPSEVSLQVQAFLQACLDLNP